MTTAAALCAVAIPVPASAAPAPAPQRPAVAYQRLALPDGRYATVYTDGLAQVVDPATGGAQFQYVPTSHAPGAPAAGTLPAKPELIAALAQGQPQPYAPDDLVVAYAPGVPAPASVRPGRARADAAHPPAYTGDAKLNKVLAGLGVDGAQPLLPGLDGGSAAQAGGGPLDVSRLYRLHLPPSTVAAAVSTLRAQPGIAYASPDWRVTTLRTGATPVAGGAAKAAVAPAAGTLPTNYAVTADAQSLLDRPGVDAMPAYAAISQRFGQLPGQGQVITNVSIGSLTDASAVGDAANPCNSWATAYGPTTIVQSGQRYLDWPGMPLIPTYTADSGGAVDPVGQVCGPDDPTLGEVGLDFSMMAPLPHDKQRPGREGSGPSDLLGIAPGASYRLMEPAEAGPTTADMAATFLAAARQQPRPSVITASLGFGFDSYGFSGRYMEDDPVMASVIATIVRSYQVVVCVSAGDGLRGYTNAAVPPSGGSAATDLAGEHSTPTDLNDVSFSTAPSLDPDTGSIDVGSTTLNDTGSGPESGAPPVGQPPYAETRYNGARNFASGWGSRVTISAPGDNVLALQHAFGGTAQDASVVYTGGTSASTPEVAAAAAVVLQVAELTKSKALTDPVKVRDFLVSTATPVADPAQSDLHLNVGPQVDLGNAVQTLLAEAGTPQEPSVSRVAVTDRHPLDGFNHVFSTATDPGAIPLDHDHLNDWLTLAPDWQGMPDHGVEYSLTVDPSGSPHGAARAEPDGSVGKRLLASTPSARLAPSAVLAAAGLPLVSTASRTVTLAYTASRGGKRLAGATVTLTFGPSDGRSTYGLAPQVPAVVRGATIPVTYDLRNLVSAADPVLVVSEPGRIDPATAAGFRPAYTVPLTQPSGTVQVPVAALGGGGIYGVGIEPATAGTSALTYTNFGYVRVAPTGDARPPAPTLAAATDRSAGGHDLAVPYGTAFRVSWDVRGVPSADGVMLEISAAGPTATGNQNPFNNPNGTVRDADGTDTGSVYYAPVTGSHGSVVLTPARAGLDTAMTHVVRVLPTRGGRVVGEASEVSTVSQDGVRPTDGGTVFGGFGVNAHGDDGFLTSNLTGGSVQLFDQRTNTVTATVAASPDRYQTPGSLGAGPAMLSGDVGLYARTAADGTQTYRVIKPVATGGDGGAWTPPAADVTPGGGTGPLPAANQDTDTTAFLYGKNGPTGAYRVFTSNVAAGTFGSPTDVEPAMRQYQFPYVTAFGQDSGDNVAVLGTSDFFQFNGPNAFVTVGLDGGQVASFPGVTAGEPDGLAVDSTTHTMIAPTGDGGIGLYDLTTGTGTRVTLAGAAHQHPAVDQVHHYFAMQELEAPSKPGAGPDDNATSAIVLVDEHGALVQRIATFNFFNTTLPINGTFVQLNPATRTGYTPGPGGTQLAVFHY